jgi:hypothetical protein
MPPPRKSRSAVYNRMPASPKRQKKSEGEPSQGDSHTDLTPVKVPTAKEIATMLLQRVWRSTFKHSLTKKHAVKFLSLPGGITIEYVKSIRFRFLIYFHKRTTIHLL